MLLLESCVHFSLPFRRARRRLLRGPPLSPWHWLCSHLQGMEMLELTKLPAFAGFTWKQFGLLAVLGIVLGLVLALTLSVPVS